MGEQRRCSGRCCCVTLVSRCCYSLIFCPLREHKDTWESTKTKRSEEPMGGSVSAPAKPRPAVPVNGISYVQPTDWPAPSSDEGALLAAAPSSYQLARRLLLVDLQSPQFPA